jgi:hypothetical protein
MQTQHAWNATNAALAAPHRSASRGRVRQLRGAGPNLRKRRKHLGGAPAAQHYPIRVDRDQGPEPILLQTLACLMRQGGGYR